MQARHRCFGLETPSLNRSEATPAGEIAIPALFSNQIRTSGIMVGSRTDQENMIRAITAKRLKPVIDRQHPLQDIVGAFKYFESRQHFSKVCIEL